MSGRKVLLVESDAAVAAEVSAFLSEAGDEVTLTSSDGALAAAVEAPADLFVVRAELDGATGYAVCDAFKADPRTERVPVVLYASDPGAQVADDHRCGPTRADGYITWPFSPGTLLDELDLLTMSGSMGTVEVVDEDAFGMGELDDDLDLLVDTDGLLAEELVQVPAAPAPAPSVVDDEESATVTGPLPTGATGEELGLDPEGLPTHTPLPPPDFDALDAELSALDVAGGAVEEEMAGIDVSDLDLLVDEVETPLDAEAAGERMDDALDALEPRFEDLLEPSPGDAVPERRATTLDLDIDEELEDLALALPPPPAAEPAEPAAEPEVTAGAPPERDVSEVAAAEPPEPENPAAAAAEAPEPPAPEIPVAEAAEPPEPEIPAAAAAESPEPEVPAALAAEPAPAPAAEDESEDERTISPIEVGEEDIAVVVDAFDDGERSLTQPSDSRFDAPLHDDATQGEAQPSADVESDDAAQAVRREVAAMRAEFALEHKAAQVALAEGRRSQEALELELEAARREAAAARLEREGIQVELQRARQERDDAVGAADRHHSLTEEHRGAVQEALKAAAEAAELARTDAEAARAQVQELVVELGRVRDQVDTAVAERQALETQHAACGQAAERDREALAGLTAARDDLAQRLAGSDERVREAEDELAWARSAISAAAEELGEQQAEALRLGTEVEGARAAAESAQAALAPAEQAAEAERAARLTAEQAVERAEAGAAEATAAFEQARTEAAAARSEQESAAARVGEVEAAAVDLTRERDELTAANEALRSRSAELESELAQATAAEGRARAEHEAAVQRAETLEAEVGGARREVEALGAQVEALGAQVEASRGAAEELGALRERFTGLEEKNQQNEKRLLRALQRMKVDDRVRAQVTKAVRIALSLLEQRTTDKQAEPEPAPEDE